jgi:WD40 repeat protein
VSGKVVACNDEREIEREIERERERERANRLWSQPSRTHVTSIQFEQDGDVVTADSDGFITVYSVDADGAYFIRMEFEAHNKGISSLVMLSEGTLLSGGEKDRKIAAWDSLQNYKRITDTKVPLVICPVALYHCIPPIRSNF